MYKYSRGLSLSRPGLVLSRPLQSLSPPPQVLGRPGLSRPLQAFPWSGLVTHTQGQIKIIGTFTLVFSSSIFEPGAWEMLILNSGGPALFLKSANSWARSAIAYPRIS
jgi:hypothetical protein